MSSRLFIFGNPNSKRDVRETYDAALEGGNMEVALAAGERLYEMFSAKRVALVERSIILRRLGASQERMRSEQSKIRRIDKNLSRLASEGRILAYSGACIRQEDMN